MRMGPHDAFFRHVPALDLVRLSQTCRLLRDLVRDICFNVSRLLSPFFGDNVDRFREIQADTATLVSGSAGLQFFNREIWPDSDLDVYAHRGSARAPALFLASIGYAFEPRASQDADLRKQLGASERDREPSYLGRGIADVLDFTKGDRKIQLIIAVSTPMEVILSFHSTVVMNILTHDHAYCLYPRSTFIYKNAVIIETVGAGQEDGRQKYIDRGWEMIKAPPMSVLASRGSELSIRAGTRWAGDTFTWTIPLRARRTAGISATPDLCPLNSWLLEYNGRLRAKTKWAFLETTQLRFKYTIADRTALEEEWVAVRGASTSRYVDAELCNALVLRRRIREHQDSKDYAVL
ncbi:hypothetical protein B0H10DRAFT_2206605 [Mycena sp. CBHHK59/15]|nr:hypothetical protein B0H10DRAFT_2206605 [Mycena sp. CBHHK59/15]